MRVLIVSIAFPPKNDPECLQTGKYFYYLSKNRELNIDILTSSIPTLFMDIDQTLKRYDTGWDNKYELNIPENKYTNFLIRKISPFGIDFPDSKFLFHRQWRKAIKKIKKNPDIIYSRSYPVSSTIMAYHLSRYYKVPWIMHLSDPWLLSPIHHYNKWQLEYHQRWERKCFESADKICMTSHKAIDLYIDHYPEFRNKFEYFPNVYDPDDIKNNQITLNKKLRFVYTGGLTNERSIKWFIPAFKTLSKENPCLESDLEFIFAGDMDRKNKDLFEKFNFPFVTHMGVISYHRTLELQRSAHVLINIDNPLKDFEKAVFFPSKLLDYFVAKRRILCLTTPGSASDEILKNYPSDICENRDQYLIMKYIKRAINEWKTNNISYFEVNQLLEAYDASVNAKRLSALFRDLVNMKNKSLN